MGKRQKIVSNSAFKIAYKDTSEYRPEFMEKLHLPAVSRAEGQITLPGSKSISNRTLLLAALASGTTEILDLLASDDTARMLEALEKLGVKLENFAENAWRVTGCNGNFPNKDAELFLGNAGTA